MKPNIGGLTIDNQEPTMPAFSPGVEEQMDDFMRSIRRYRLSSISIFAFSGVLMLALLAVASSFSDQLHRFFDNWIGGKVGNAMVGLSAAVFASTPMLIAMIWQMRRSKRLESKCLNCSVSFAAAGRAEIVIQKNKCPKCGIEIFSELTT